MPKAWDRLPGEPAKEYSWFEYFFRIDPIFRNRKKAYTSYRIGLWELKGCNGAKPNPKSAPPTWDIAYEQYKWEERAAKYDDFRRWERQQEEKAERIRRIQLRRDRRQQLEDRAWAAMEKLITLGEEMSRSPLYSKVLQDDGKTVIINPAKWSFADIARMMDVAMKMGRIASGLETGEVEELKAMATLVNAGWYGDQALDNLAMDMDKLRENARAITDGQPPDTTIDINQPSPIGEDIKLEENSSED